MLSKTEIDQKFSALKEHGEEVAEKFKEFVEHLDNALPDGVSKTMLVNSLEMASKWAHIALNYGEAQVKQMSHQRAKSGEKTPSEVDEAQGSAPTLTNALDTKTDDSTPPVKAPPAA